ncbi:hypothetical protein AMTR_s00085p00167450 [Amborella trichopoda]|uniref:Uncharacterized protein n=1 Tax=Amborella trichopoda TaxID=13333 RepID=W1P6Y4_AMBTC|nr:hypothetical protein AMTR_s00085p00167450 [Amborella trichopoda]
MAKARGRGGRSQRIPPPSFEDLEGDDDDEDGDDGEAIDEEERERERRRIAIRTHRRRELDLIEADDELFKEQVDMEADHGPMSGHDKQGDLFGRMLDLPLGLGMVAHSRAPSFPESDSGAVSPYSSVVIWAIVIEQRAALYEEAAPYFSLMRM